MTATGHSIPRDKFRRRSARLLGVLALAPLLLVGCHESPVPSTNENTAADPKPPAVEVKPEPVPTRVTIQVQGTDPNQWLSILAVKKDRTGGWATGSFDEKRNRLTIQTKDVTAFSVDTNRIPIRWQKLVVLSLDGRRTELKKRDAAILHFTLDEHAQWVVLEP